MNPFLRLRAWIEETLRREAVKNLGFIYASRMISAFLRLAASVVVARKLGAERLGLLTIAAVIMGIVARLLELGMTTTLVRKVSHHLGAGDRDGAASIFRRIIVFQLELSAAALVLGWFAAPLLAIRVYGNAALVTPVRLAFAGAVAYNIWYHAEGVLRAHERFKAIAYINIASQSVRTGLILLLALVIAGLDVERTMMINIAQILVAFVITAVLIPGRYFRSGGGERYPLGRVFAYSGWMYLFSLIFMLFDRLDVLMLGFFRAGSEVGVYAVAFRLIIPFEMIPETFNTVFLPRVSRFTRKFEIMRYFRDTLKVTALVGVLGLIMLFAARPLIMTFYGAEYEPSIRLFQILVGAFILLTMLNPFTLAGHSINKPQIFVLMAAINLVLNFAGNLVFIPRYGATGAAVVTLLSRVAGGLIGLLILKRFLDRWQEGASGEETG